MVTKKLLSFFFFFFILLFFTTNHDKANFSGEWKLNEEKS